MLLDVAEEHGQICRARLEHVVDVREPLVLISQVPRSGGTLLSRLFDGHPECHAHPYELKVGSSKTRRRPWPELDLGRPESWFKTLYEKDTAKHLVAGYSKPGLKTTDVDVFPFVFLPSLQEQVFHACLAARPGEHERDVYDAYFTSYFNAWLDNQNLYSGPKRVVTGFTPGKGLDLESVGRFFATYPDGWLISLVREPRAWYRSASRNQPRFENLEKAMRIWRRSAEGALEARRRFGERLIVLTYEDVVLETEATMERLAERLGISMSPILLTPTFNGRRIRANSSDPVESYGILPGRTDAYRGLLDASELARIDELAGDVHERARDLARTLV